MNGKQLKDLREKYGYSQESLANELNVSRKTINTYESKDEIPESKQHLLKLFFSNLSNEKLHNDESKVIEVKKYHKGVPYFENIDGTATITTSFNDYPESPAFYIDYEHFNDCDAYIQVVGDSMYPAYSSGEIIAVKRIMNFDVIQWGEVYFVVTNGNANDMKTVKQLHYHEDLDKIILRSSNPYFKGDTIVKKKDILYLYIVKGKIRRNQL